MIWQIFLGYWIVCFIILQIYMIKATIESFKDDFILDTYEQGNHIDKSLYWISWEFTMLIFSGCLIPLFIYDDLKKLKEVPFIR